MSKLFRSRDIKDTRVTNVDLRSKPIAAPQSKRPVGGFAGLRVDHADVPLSQIETLEREAMARVEQARREAEQIQRDAYHAGFEQGEKAGQKLALQKAEPTIQAFTSLIEHVENDRQMLIQQHERELIKVAYLIAQRVLHQTLSQSPESVRAVVAAAVAKIDGPQAMTLLVSPLDKPLIESEMTHGMLKDRFTHTPTLLADESITRGGCRVITETGDVDATIEAQLRAIRDGLWDTEAETEGPDVEA